MAYQTGTVNSLADIQMVIRVFLMDNGWTWDSGSSTIYKGTVFVETLLDTPNAKLYFRGATALGTGYSAYVSLGKLWHQSGVPTLEVTFPATYFMFLNGDEFYFVVRYDVARFQFVTFGKSAIDLSASGGVGTFLSATGNSVVHQDWWPPVHTDADGSIAFNGTALGAISGGPFFGNNAPYSYSEPTSFVHSNLDGHAWDLRFGLYSVGNSYKGNLLATLPNQWNLESPLLPIRAYKARSDSKVSLVLDLQHARHCRVDNFNDAEIISIGPDQWQVFPHHRKNTADRNGGPNVDHTGTFGWAIRKVD